MHNVQTGNEVEFTVTGELLNGTKFEGSDTIKVIDKANGPKKKMKKNVNARITLKSMITKMNVTTVMNVMMKTNVMTM